jgi:hypothetical protein
MAKRGPKRARYEAEDRIYHVRALDLVRAGETKWAAAQAVVDDKMKGDGDDYSKARRIHSWLIKHGDYEPPLLRLYEGRNILADIFAKLTAKKRQGRN